jgi:glutamate--cysteine ligase
MQTPCAAYEEIGLKKQGQYQQLNTNILQIENEYYASGHITFVVKLPKCFARRF